MKDKIHTLVFLGFTAAAALALSGCVADNRPPPPTTSCLDQRFATVGWTIEKQATRAPLSCIQANAQTVYLFFGPYSYQFNCDAFQGTTDNGLPPGNYDTSMQLISPSGQVLSDTAIPGGPSSFPIYNCMQDDIPDVPFAIQ